jgi:hypothetical protein
MRGNEGNVSFVGCRSEMEAVSVMTFNVRYDEESDGEDRWARRRGDVIHEGEAPSGLGSPRGTCAPEG